MNQLSSLNVARNSSTEGFMGKYEYMLCFSLPTYQEKQNCTSLTMKHKSPSLLKISNRLKMIQLKKKVCFAETAAGLLSAAVLCTTGFFFFSLRHLFAADKFQTSLVFADSTHLKQWDFSGFQ